MLTMTRRPLFAALLVFAVAFLGCGAAQTAISEEPDTPFKLATFSPAGGESRVGLVLGERIFDVRAANEHLVSAAGLAALDAPNEMRALIEQYDSVKSRLYQMANHFANDTESHPFVYDAGAVTIEAPIQYPWNLLAAAANYRSHAAEMDTEANVDPSKDFPYLFAKSPRSCIIGTKEPYFIPRGRERIDWEGELGVVIGPRPAYDVSVEDALDYVFGFTVVYDVSDRGGAPRENPMFTGPDWFSGKSRDRAAPMGPYITPIEFLPNHADLSLVTKINERVVQDASTKDMIYDTAHLVHYVSRIMTLYPGDVIATGTPDGVGAGREPPEFVKPGDVVSIAIEGIGTLETPIEAASPTS